MALDTISNLSLIILLFSSKELGDYSASVIDRPVEWGWNLKEADEYKIKKVHCGNGFTVVVQVPLDSRTFYDTEHVNYNKVAVKLDMLESDRRIIELHTVTQSDEK